jgi:transcriptional regulator with XRE-family HTH domain
MEAVRQIRKERGLSQQALSELAGINKVTLVHIETGKSSPNVDTLEKLARALDVEVADFFPKAEPSLFSPESVSPEQGRHPNERDIEALFQYLSRVGQQLDEGKMRRRDVEHELDVLRAFGPAVYSVLGDEIADYILQLGHQLLDEARRLKIRELAEAEAGVRRLDELRERRAS